MPTIELVSQFLDRFAPTRLAEDWDNVGLLAGDKATEVQRIMTCLTITPESAQEAIDRNAQLIVSHHPLPFRPLKQITTEAVPTKLLWDLIRAGVAIYSPHTGFDSAAQGINQSLGTKLGIEKLVPVHQIKDDPDQLGAGRMGRLPAALSLQAFLDRVKDEFGLSTLQIVGDFDQKVHKVGIACGSGGTFLSKAIRKGCDTFVTGESNFHTALEAKANGVALILLGHFHSERFAVEMLAGEIQNAFADDIHVWASESEVDPLAFV